MRNAFVQSLFELAKNDQRIVLITGDLGFSVIEPFVEQLPRQFVNAGVAEQNMTGMAVGMALSGKVVFTYSIANFPTLRCLEQIRNDVCYHNANVKIVAVGGGFSYGSMGVTHHAVEDLGVMRMLPGMVVVAPGDPLETRLAAKACATHAGPCYLRLGKAGEPSVHTGEINFQLGKAVVVREGKDLALISTGALLRTTVDAADRLAALGIQPRVLSMHTLKPLDSESVMLAARETGVIVTIEEHSIIGGLGSAVSEVLAEASETEGVRFKRIGLPSEFSPHIGSQDYLRCQHSLTAESIVDSVRSVLKTAKAVV